MIQEIFLKLKTNIKVVWFLISINIIFYILSIGLTTITSNYQMSLYLLGAEEGVSIVANAEYFRLLTSAFLHGGLLHILLNMWVLSSIGNTVEIFYGAKKLFIVYIVSAVFASIVSVSSNLVGLYLGTADSSTIGISVGASGAVFGLVGIILGNKYKNNTYSVELENYIDMQKLWMYVIYNVIIGFGFNLLGTTTGINNYAHIGGFLAGFVLGLFLDPVNTFYKSKAKSIAERTLFVLSVVFTIYSFLSLISNFIF